MTSPKIEMFIEENIDILDIQLQKQIMDKKAQIASKSYYEALDSIAYTKAGLSWGLSLIEKQDRINEYDYIPYIICDETKERVILTYNNEGISHFEAETTCIKEIIKRLRNH